MLMELYPLKFAPIYKKRVWGGCNLSIVLGRELPLEGTIGESWELSANEGAVSSISNGCFRGMTLAELISTYSKEILGEGYQCFQEKFPLLFKYIDANDKLSLQVHPPDKYALSSDGELGKTEAWYILQAKPGAKLVHGLKEGINSKCFLQAIKNNCLEDMLNEIEVKAGDVLFVPAGTVHAIGEGLVIAEIQQNSDVTYRIFDWNRLGSDEKPRQLHIEKALDVINFSKGVDHSLSSGITVDEDGFRTTFHVHCAYFTLELLDIYKRCHCAKRPKRFEVLMCIGGDFEIQFNDQKETLSVGETVLIPASLEGYDIVGEGKIIKTYIAEEKEVYDKLLDKGFQAKEITKIMHT